MKVGAGHRQEQKSIIRAPDPDHDGILSEDDQFRFFKRTHFEGIKNLASGG